MIRLIVFFFHHQIYFYQIFLVRHDHNSEMDLQAQSHQIEFRSLETKHLTVLQDHEARHSDILQEMEEKWKQTIARQLEDKTQELNQLTDDLERQSEKYQEMKQNLEHQLHSVQNELRQQEMAVTAKHKGMYYNKYVKCYLLDIYLYNIQIGPENLKKKIRAPKKLVK